MRRIVPEVGTRVLLGFLLVIVTTASSCGLGSGVLSSTEAKQLLLQLPYRYRWRPVEPPEGASGAIAGTAVGRHHTIVHFGISLGTEAEAVPVPHAGVRIPEEYGENGFVFNDDLEIPGKNENIHPGKQFHTGAQWNEAARIVVEMEDKLCEAGSGKPCPGY